MSCLAVVSGASLMLARGADPLPQNSNLSASLTNLSNAGLKKDGLKQLEDELSRSLQPFSPRGSLDSILTPRYIPSPVAPNRQPSSSESRRNWPFDDPAGLGPDPFKSMNGPGKRNSLEDIFNTMDKSRSTGNAGSSRPETAKRPGARPFDELDEDMKLPSGIRESAKKLRDKLFGADTLFDTGSANRGGLSGLLPPDDRLSREQIQAHQDYVQRFRQTMDIPGPWTTPDNPLSSLGFGAGRTLPVVTSPLPGATTPREGFAATPMAVDSLLHSTVLPDLSQQVVNQWNPLYAAPKVEAPPPASFTPPMMEVPRRKFY